MSRAAASRRAPVAGGFLLSATVPAERVPPGPGYPYSIPAVRALLAPGELAFHPRVTFLVGENGSGKSTLAEAIAVAAGFNAEGGSKHFAFATRRTESPLHEALRLVRGPRRERGGFFLRAESLYNVATEIEEMVAREPPDVKRRLLDSYGGRSLHAQSHGEAFIALAIHRFGPDGLYVLDEPEAALSPQRQLGLLALLHDRVSRGGCQFVVATHSPFLLAYPDAAIFLLDERGMTPTAYEDTEHYRVTRDFLANRETYLRHLLSSPDGEGVAADP